MFDRKLFMIINVHLYSCYVLHWSLVGTEFIHVCHNSVLNFNEAWYYYPRNTNIFTGCE